MRVVTSRASGHYLCATYTRTMPAIDLNADVGEECGDDAALLAVVSTANVAAGGHAGGGDLLRQTVGHAVDASVAVGAHPSYPDREGFGRVSRLSDHDAPSLTALVREQVLDVAEACAAHSTVMTHVKAHGALYHDLVAHPEASVAFFQAVADVAAESGTPIAALGPPAPSVQRDAEAAGVPYLVEAFADRRYLADGTLMPRSEPGAVLIDSREVVDQVLALALDGRVSTSVGTTLRIDAASICLHGDTPDAVALATIVRTALAAEGIRIEHPSRT